MTKKSTRFATIGKEDRRGQLYFLTTKLLEYEHKPTTRVLGNIPNNFEHWEPAVL